MCFSAEASFTGAAILAGIGCVTIKHAHSKEDVLWVSIPFFFAIQQFSEGIVWLGLTHQMASQTMAMLAKNLYLFFALGFWPICIPLAFLLPEKDPAKKKILLLTLVLGIGIAYTNLSMLPPSELFPSVTGHSIRYFVEAPFYKKSLYLLVVALPSFISSIKHTWVFGLATIATCLAAEHFFTAAFTSVWCFAAAIMSLVLYGIARSHSKKQNMQTTAHHKSEPHKLD